ncbi:hypothetical protein MP228_010318 [Amoeboaphelidium protococcarum]|nr:hypothetical protein MP228_010318 [Amoeboaphelidium protococcarum]
MQSLLGLGAPSVDIQITLNNEDQRKKIAVPLRLSRSEMKNGSTMSLDKAEQKTELFPLYFDGEPVKGKILIKAKDGKKVEHNGIKCEFVGQIELFNDRGNHNEFLTLRNELAAPGELRHTVNYDFEFRNVEKQYECYRGINARLRYMVRVTISRRLSDIINEKDVWVYNYKIPPQVNDSIRMEVGIEDCLHIEFEYNKSKYNMKDVIVGKIYFLLVRIKVKHMELSIIRRETVGAPPNQYNENETVVKHEIMDGAPIRGETIPLRLFLSPLNLTPTFRDVNKRFSVRYYLNLVLIDEENRRYFKQQEVTVFRTRNSDEVQIEESMPVGMAQALQAWQ